MKYNDPVILQENTIYQMILEKIEKGSRVLEFGAAGGRMTKLLNRDFGCTVYIVEYEKEACDLAMQYAKEGLCADIEEYGWKKWQGEAFDYILFCDVLEHLKNPKKVLEQTKDLLKDDGTVFLSLPNICHNDIIVQLFENRFAYTNVGLLDDTHIRFFSEKTLSSFVKGTGYVLTSKRYKTIPTGMTEQYWREPFTCPDELYALLQKRENGEVYQFVLELKKECACTDRAAYAQKASYPLLHGLIYFDRGNGFSEEDVQKITGVRIRKDEYEYQGNIFLEEGIRQFRIDPIERQECELLKVTCSLGSGMVPDGINVCGKHVISNDDPQIIWEVPKGGITVSYEVRVSLDRKRLLKDLVHHSRLLDGQITDQNKICRQKDEMLDQKKKELAGKEEELIQKKKELAGNEQELIQKKKELAGNKQELIQKKKELAEKEEKLAVLQKNCVRIEKLNSTLQDKNAELKEKLTGMKGKAIRMEQELRQVYHSKSWRYTKVFRKLSGWLHEKAD